MKPLLKLVLSYVLALAILFTPIAFAYSEPPPDAAAACIVAIIGIGCAGFLVYGLYRMCQHIPAPDSEPPPWAPLSEIPGMGPPTYMHPLPPLKLSSQLFTSRVKLQHNDNDRSGWQTDYSFVPTESQIGGVAMIACDANGEPIMTNDVPLVTYGGELCAPLMFTNLPPVAGASAARMYRLVGQ